MRLSTVGYMMITLAATMQVRNLAPTSRTSVAICIEYDSQPVAVQAARNVASRLLATADVNLAWQTGFKGCPENALRITLSNRTSPTEHPGAFGYAMPYTRLHEGAGIRVFADRVAAAEPGPWMPQFLGHVIAHEITHSLEGIVRHSETGLMRANWTPNDHARMRSGPMTLDPVDAELIHVGLARR